MAMDPELARFLIVLKEFKGGQTAFGEALDVDQSTISKTKSGKLKLSLHLVRGMIYKLGYTPEWVINGTGDKKRKKGDDVKLITEIGMLRTEMDIMFQKNKALDARMKAYESEQKKLKELIERFTTEKAK